MRTAAGWAVSELCRRPELVHREVHVELQEVVNPVGDWTASDQSRCGIGSDAKSIPIRACDSGKPIAWYGLDFAQSGLKLVASEAELHQIDAEVPEAVIICFGRELVHRRDGLSHDRVMLDAVDDPRGQVDSPV